MKLGKKQQELLESYTEQLNQYKNLDPEQAHSLADECLCEILRDLGFGKLVDVYNEIEKWYA